MTRAQQAGLVVAVALAAAVAGGAAYLWRFNGDPEAAAAIMAAPLVDVDGRPQSLDHWRGQVLVVNFWATWCAPCREEIPLFVRLQEKYRGRGLQFVGIAIDRAEAVRAFAAEFRMNYPVLLGGIDTVEISRRAGNRVGALPFTLILDRSGRVVSRQLGVAKEATLEAVIQPLL